MEKTFFKELLHRLDENRFTRPILRFLFEEEKEELNLHTHNPQHTFELVRNNTILNYHYTLRAYDMADEHVYTIGYMADGPQIKFYESALYLMEFKIPKLTQSMTFAIESTGLTYRDFADKFYELTIETIQEQAIIEDVTFAALDKRTFPRVAKTSITRKYI